MAITVNLDRQDLFNIVIGTVPPYQLHKELEARGLGTSVAWGWSWSRWGLEELTDDELFIVYQQCKSGKDY